MKILLDNGHGRETPGKRSPDGRLLEWSYTRDLARAVERELTLKGVDCMRLVPEDWDVPLRERVRRANAWARKLGAANVALVSIHCNAAGYGGKWCTARGWSVFVAPNASARSKALAEDLAAEAAAEGLTVRRQRPDAGYWTQSLAMCRDTVCPAVLTENMFMDSAEDCAWLLSEEGKRALRDVHCRGIINYIREMQS